MIDGVVTAATRPAATTRTDVPPLRAYRTDVQALRGLAVFLVVAFHARVLFQGGFVGVDVFFVISGFLISGMLLEELQRTDRIGLLDFYARRARRLFPALALVCLVTLGLGAIFLLPFGEQQELAKSSIATSLFASNVFFWMGSGYFDGPAEQKPLLNMWTLSVEEQFYWVWPILLIALWRGARLRDDAPRLRKLFIAAGLAVIVAVSLWSCVRLTATTPATAFYMMPLRSWEFALGGLIALAPQRQDRAANASFSSILGIAGLAMIIAAVAGFSRVTPFPGIAAALPAVGTALLIYSGAMAGSLTHRLLSLPLLVAIGQLSYSWYLWHWPLIALARAYAFGVHDFARDSLLALAALLLAWITYRFVENPIRRGTQGPFSTTRGALIGGAGLLSMIAAASLALGLHAKSIGPSSGRYGALLAAMEDATDLTPECRSDFSQIAYPGALEPIDKCKLGAAARPARVLLWGDSFAKQYEPVLDRFGKNESFTVVARVLDGCAPLLDTVTLWHGMPRRDCVAFNPLVKAELHTLKAMGVDAVVLAANWLAYFPPAGDADWSAQQSPDVFEAGLRRTLDELDTYGFKVLLVAQSPRFPISVPHCLGRSFRGRARRSATCRARRGLRYLCLPESLR